MPRAIVIYTTRFGNTEKAFMAICEGLREGGLNCDCKSIVEVTPGDMANYDVVLFGAPTHANGIPDEMGEFMESLKKVKLSGNMGAAFDTRYEDAEVGRNKRLRVVHEKVWYPPPFTRIGGSFAQRSLQGASSRK